MVTVRLEADYKSEGDRNREQRHWMKAQAGKLRIYAGLVFDSREKAFHPNWAITVDVATGLVTDVNKHSTYSQFCYDVADPELSVLDFRDLTVLPGFVDAHTHIFLHSYSETPSINQERDESMVERIVRGTNHARSALLAGFTTYRDLGSEGLGDADAAFRDTINRGLIPGPRMLVATDPLASSSGYELRYESRMNGTIVPRMSDACDGVDGVRAGVRRRIGAGADLIKFYADYRRRALRVPQPSWPGSMPIQHPPCKPTRFPPSFMSLTLAGYEGTAGPNCTNFTQEEMTAVVGEANRAGAPVAAHAMADEAIIMAAKAGVTTIEHGSLATREALQSMKHNNVIFVPTLSVLESGGSPVPGLFETACQVVKDAHQMGVKIAAGGDLGAGAGHGTNAHEMELLHKAGVPIEDALRAGTLSGWEACGGDRSGYRFGWISEGWIGDLVAVRGDPRHDIKVVRSVEWVVKNGKIVVQDGTLVP